MAEYSMRIPTEWPIHINATVLLKMQAAMLLKFGRSRASGLSFPSRAAILSCDVTGMTDFQDA